MANLQHTPSPASLPFRVGHFEVFLASTPKEVEEVQAMRYRVFGEEMGGQTGTEGTWFSRIDRDKYDDWCDHMCVRDLETGQVVGTYRLLRGPQIPKGETFYTEQEFDLSALRAQKANLLEVGRSCVAKEARSTPAMQLLWRAISTVYNPSYEIDFLFGCGSFPGTDPKLYQEELNLLYRDYLAPADIRPKALPERFVATPPCDIGEAKLIHRRLPTLIRGYLRVGAYVGQGAVIDSYANTLDVCILLPVSRITQKYQRHFQNQI